MLRFIKRWLPSKDEMSSPGKLLGQSIVLMRREYAGKPFSEELSKPNPIDQFEIWFNDAVASEKLDPNAMTLSTVSSTGRPTARVVLLKEYNQTGFTFYTSYSGRKGREMQSNPNVCLNFFWPTLIRQVRIEGVVEKVSKKKSEEYFSSRPRASQLSAYASSQSEKLKSRKELEEKVKVLDKRFAEVNVPLPPEWGGYRVLPNYFEFWQGRVNRLHDRLCYELSDSGEWSTSRLAP